MSTRQHPLTPSEIRMAFVATAASPAEPNAGVILTPSGLAQILGLSVKTIYEWIAKGRLDGAFRKRGKHVLIWRDRAIALLMNGKDWTHE